MAWKTSWRSGAGGDYRTERVERVQRAVRRPTRMRLPTWDFELAPGFGRHPDLARLLEIEHARESLERIGVVGEFDRPPFLLDPQDLGIS